MQSYNYTKIEKIIEKGIPKLKILKYYPNWSWLITDRDNPKIHVIITPDWETMKQAIKETIIHEMQVDMTIPRNPDRQRYMKFLNDMSKMCKDLQTTINDYEIHPIIKECIKDEFKDRY